MSLKGTGKLSLTFCILVPYTLSLLACTHANVSASTFTVSSTQGNQLTAESLGNFNQPWAMTFLPDGVLLLTEKTGALWLLEADIADSENGDVADQMENASEGSINPVRVAGLPEITARGQGGLGDVILHPQFDENGLTYLSFVERDASGSGAAVARARLDRSSASAPVLEDWQIIWRQEPKLEGNGHFGHRLAFSSDGYLFITSGERQAFDPAQDMDQNLGKIVRLLDDGSVPRDNPFAEQGGLAAQVWTLGHRNPLGIAFDLQGRLWAHEMGPRGGDELNEIVVGLNYGYPLVSNGRHYSGLPIPDHDTRPDLQAPAISWSPVISPAGFVIYSGGRYKDWKGSGLIGGLSSRSLVRVSLGDDSQELERFDMGNRIREVEQGPSGLIYLLEDREGGRLLRLAPDP
ncbi:MAG: PQQ-dependent sugar dehydrogenase [Granulosicoccus sp.]